MQTSAARRRGPLSATVLLPLHVVKEALKMEETSSFPALTPHPGRPSSLVALVAHVSLPSEIDDVQDGRLCVSSLEGSMQTYAEVAR